MFLEEVERTTRDYDLFFVRGEYLYNKREEEREKDRVRKRRCG